jgi:8-oxo-dGTP pyrophosphatase MutT (NUDIX family)
MYSCGSSLKQQQMYRIYINQQALILSAQPMARSNEQQLQARYSGKAKSLLNYVDMMEKSRRFAWVNLYHPQVEQLFLDFCSHFERVEAAGGLVHNSAQALLLIFRLGFWDLPKGKIDPGETPAEAALREVREETGLQEVQLGELVTITYHTYRDRHLRRVLKPTYWYRMFTAETQLSPQAEENIEKAVWMGKGDPLPPDDQLYNSLSALIKSELSV